MWQFEGWDLVSILVLTCWREMIGLWVRRSIYDHLRRLVVDLLVVLDMVCIVKEVLEVVGLDCSIWVIMELIPGIDCALQYQEIPWVEIWEDHELRESFSSQTKRMKNEMNFWMDR